MNNSYKKYLEEENEKLEREISQVRNELEKHQNENKLSATTYTGDFLITNDIETQTTQYNTKESFMIKLEEIEKICNKIREQQEADTNKNHKSIIQKIKYLFTKKGRLI